jgi:hypothetical protein
VSTKTPAPVLESTTQAEIEKRFATTSWCRLFRINVGTYMTMDGRRYVKTAVNGYPDLQGHLIDGRCLYIETKSAKGRASKEQQAFAAMARQFHTVHVIARSVADVEQALREAGYGALVDGDGDTGGGK